MEHSVNSKDHALRLDIRESDIDRCDTCHLRNLTNIRTTNVCIIKNYSRHAYLIGIMKDEGSKNFKRNSQVNIQHNFNASKRFADATVGKMFLVSLVAFNLKLFERF